MEAPENAVKLDRGGDEALPPGDSMMKPGVG